MAGMAVVDASAVVDLITLTARATAVEAALAERKIHAPAHIDAEVLSAVGRMNRASEVHTGAVDTVFDDLVRMPLVRHLAYDLVRDAWTYRHDVRLTDALYVALAARLGAPLITTDVRLSRAGSVRDVRIEVI